MRTVGLPGQHGSRPQHIKRLPGAEPRGAAVPPVRILRAGVPRARRVPHVPAAAGEAAGEAASVRAVVCAARVVVLCARPSRREHRLDDQIKDLFLTEVVSVVIVRASVAASSGGTATVSVCRAAAAAAAAVTRRAVVSRKPRR